MWNLKLRDQFMRSFFHFVKTFYTLPFIMKPMDYRWDEPMGLREETNKT